MNPAKYTARDGPVIRGSTGFGRKLFETSFKQWGLLMQDDITDGVERLVKDGIADPKQVAISGAMETFLAKHLQKG